MIDIVGELDRIDYFKYAGVNENGGNNNVENPPDEQFNHLTILFHPGFPAAVEHKHVRKLRFLPQPLGYFAGQIAVLRTTINNYLFSRRQRIVKWLNCSSGGFSTL